MGKSDCPFCPIQHRTPWHFREPILRGAGLFEVVVCEDLQPMEYDLRLLAVPSGLHGPDPPEGVKALVRQRLAAVVAAHEANGVFKAVKFDEELRCVPDHWHVQACLVKV